MTRKLRKLALAASLLLSMLVSGTAVSADYFIAEMFLWTGDYCPAGYMYCEGQELKINEHQELYALIGTRFGGDGNTTFKLPDMRNAEKDLKGARFIIAIKGMFPSRS